jgi:lipopolysaccharide/colanic/teichoic acid biosynthesis glycosyltransferase
MTGAIRDRRMRVDRRGDLRPDLPPIPHITSRNRIYLLGKRAFDIAGSLILLTLTAPLLVLLALLIRLDSPGPVYFRSPRRGYYGRIFEVLKFRTMRADAHTYRETLVNSSSSDRLLFKIKRDPRVTRLGQFLRQYSLDELPQLINVLRGEMSLIGPRPLLKEDFEKASSSSLFFRQWVRDRHLMRPGITGLWQVSGRTDLPLDESMRLDLEYVQRWSPWMDLKILVLTPLTVLKGKGAY